MSEPQDVRVSVIIPAYNEAKRLPNTLEQVMVYLEDQSYASEIIVVENASLDNTCLVAKEFAGQYTSTQLPITVLQEPRKGKGAAVKKGMLAAISAAITDNEANIMSAHVRATPEQDAINDFEIDIRDVNHLNKVMTSIRKLNGVTRVVRVKRT